MSGPPSHGLAVLYHKTGMNGRKLTDLLVQQMLHGLFKRTFVVRVHVPGGFIRGSTAGIR
jgi:hypothetical protein